MRKRSLSKQTAQTVLGASFRDPAGLVFKNERGEVLRQINPSGYADYTACAGAGLYADLAGRGFLVSHTEIEHPTKDSVIIEPQQIPFISYPFEWSFSQLKDAALLTLAIQKEALKHDLTLKDASAYNVQFEGGKPIFIDTLSFEKYVPGTPWQAYRQFCQHFLAPLALMSYTDLGLSQLLRVHLDGIPLDVASKLLPRTAKIRPGLAMHVVLHGRAQKAKESEHAPKTRAVAKSSLEAILGSLERTVAKLQPRRDATEWGDYYDKTNYTTGAADKKAALIREYVRPLKAKTALDLGGNNGRYSRVLNGLGITTVCTDIDPNAVEANYRFTKQHQETLMLPLLVDLTNPGGLLGWHNNERQAVHDRLQTDVVMALAIIHHLAISNNVPFEKIAEYFCAFGPNLVLEFVPKSDSQVKKLLSTRRDIFPSYNEDGLKRAFSAYYTLVKETHIKGSERTLYLFKRK